MAGNTIPQGGIHAKPYEKPPSMVDRRLDRLENGQEVHRQQVLALMEGMKGLATDMGEAVNSMGEAVSSMEQRMVALEKQVQHLDNL